MTSPFQSLRIPKLLASLLVAVVCSGLAPACEARIVAIGDIHGAYNELVSILQDTGLIDEQLAWVGSDARLVQTGDFTDRGSGVRKVMDLLMRIERQAREAGGEAHMLLGNHEVMNLILEDRDLRENPDIYASFADGGSEARRAAALAEWRSWREDRLRAQETVLEGRAVTLGEEMLRLLDPEESRWLEDHPPGLIEYRDAMSTDGIYGSWIRTLPVVLKLDDSLFIHGGVSAEYQGTSIDQLNRMHRRRIQEFSEDRAKLEKRRLVLPYFSWSETRLALEHHLAFPASAGDRALAARAWEHQNELLDELFVAESPLWYRGYAPPPLGLADAPLAELLDLTEGSFGVRRIVAGHTPVGTHSIAERLDGRVYQIDTGMLTSYYEGRASALEISASGVEAVYPNESPAVGGASVVEPAATGDQYAPPATPESEEMGSVESVAARFDRPVERVFLGPDGSPLPIQRLEDIEGFLRGANVVSKKPVGQGKSGAQKLRLELDGVESNAIFHSIDERNDNPVQATRLSDGTRVNSFRDSYLSQVASYELSKMLQMDNVPPAVTRKVEGETGSVALWIESGVNLFTWREQGNSAPRSLYFSRQMHDVRVFDAVVDNFDRNSQNIFWTGEFHVWLIDHTRSFTRNRRLQRPDQLSRCSRGLFRSLRELDDQLVHQRISPYMSKFDINALLKRRDGVLEFFDARIRARGEAQVLFDYDEAVPVRVEESGRDG